MTLLDDRRMSELHERYLGKEGPTDVLSFPLGTTPEGMLADVYVGFETARRQALDHGVPFNEEVVRLTIHGLLHVLGYEHPDPGDAVSLDIFSRQEELVHRYLGRLEDE